MATKKMFGAKARTSLLLKIEPRIINSEMLAPAPPIIMMSARTVPGAMPFPTSATLIGIMVSTRIYMEPTIAAYVPVLVSPMDFIQQIRKRTIINKDRICRFSFLPGEHTHLIYCVPSTQLTSFSQIEGRIHFWGTPHPVTPHPSFEYRYVVLNMANTQIIRSALKAKMQTSSSFLNLIT
jgi:hypothetical protein